MCFQLVFPDYHQALELRCADVLLRLPGMLLKGQSLVQIPQELLRSYFCHVLYFCAAQVGFATLAASQLLSATIQTLALTGVFCVLAQQCSDWLC